MKKYILLLTLLSVSGAPAFAQNPNLNLPIGPINGAGGNAFVFGPDIFRQFFDGLIRTPSGAGLLSPRAFFFSSRFFYMNWGTALHRTAWDFRFVRSRFSFSGVWPAYRANRIARATSS